MAKELSEKDKEVYLAHLKNVERSPILTMITLIIKILVQLLVLFIVIGGLIVLAGLVWKWLWVVW